MTIFNPALLNTIASILWLSLTALLVPFIGGWIVKKSWEFFERRLKKCPKCGGYGLLYNYEVGTDSDDNGPYRSKCTLCNGSGFVDETSKDPWPFSKDRMSLYQWGGKLNTEINALYELRCSGLDFSLVKMRSMSWKPNHDVKGMEMGMEVTLIFDTVKLEEVTVSLVTADEEVAKKREEVINKYMAGRGIFIPKWSILSPTGKVLYWSEIDNMDEAFAEFARVIGDSVGKLITEGYMIEKFVDKPYDRRPVTAKSVWIDDLDKRYEESIEKYVKKQNEFIENEILSKCSPLYGDEPKEARWVVLSPKGQSLFNMTHKSSKEVLKAYANTRGKTVDYLLALGYRVAREVM